MDAPANLPSLDDIRREIDAVDDQLLELVARRLSAVEHVRLAKSRSGGIAQSPIRPGREAYILRKLIEKAKGRVPAELCVRLWRALIATATLQQAQVGVHVSAALHADAAARVLISEHFGGVDLVTHPDVAAVLTAVAAKAGDVAAVSVDAPWPEAFLQGAAGAAQVICCLPFLAGSTMPSLLVFGHAPPEPTGDDETLIIAPHKIAAPALWQTEIGGCHVVSLLGFMTGSEPALAGVTIAGRYPRPITARR